MCSSSSGLDAAAGKELEILQDGEELPLPNRRVFLLNGGQRVRADVARAADVEALIAKAIDTFGQLDCACNNAGIEGKVAPIAAQPEDNFDSIMAVNAKGTFLCMKYEIAHMLKNGGGAIVNLASVAGLVGFPGLGPYVASKHAINGLTKNAALEYSKQGIRVNSVCPGGIETRMMHSLAAQASGGRIGTREMMDPLHPIGRIGMPNEVADHCVALLTLRILRDWSERPRRWWLRRSIAA